MNLNESRKIINEICKLLLLYLNNLFNAQSELTMISFFILKLRMSLYNIILCFQYSVYKLYHFTFMSYLNDTPTIKYESFYENVG